MHRGTDEQEEEISELEAKIKRQRAVLEQLRDIGSTFEKGVQQPVDPDAMQT